MIDYIGDIVVLELYEGTINWSNTTIFDENLALAVHECR